MKIPLDRNDIQHIYDLLVEDMEMGQDFIESHPHHGESEIAMQSVMRSKAVLDKIKESCMIQLLSDDDDTAMENRFRRN